MLLAWGFESPLSHQEEITGKLLRIRLDGVPSGFFYAIMRQGLFSKKVVYSCYEIFIPFFKQKGRKLQFFKNQEEKLAVGRCVVV